MRRKWRKKCPCSRRTGRSGCGSGWCTTLLWAASSGAVAAGGVGGWLEEHLQYQVLWCEPVTCARMVGLGPLEPCGPPPLTAMCFWHEGGRGRGTDLGPLLCALPVGWADLVDLGLGIQQALGECLLSRQMAGEELSTVVAGGVQQVRAWIGKGNGGNKRGGGQGLASQGAQGPWYLLPPPSGSRC